MSNRLHPVLCFDRDLCIDVNPPTNAAGASIMTPDMQLTGSIPEDARAVPLVWLQHWAHEQCLNVWATGNQHLRKEAMIPGLRDAEDLWHLYWTDEYDYQEQVSEYGKPQRRDGLRLIKDVYEGIYPDREYDFVVVDDADLSEMTAEGWTHYFPWEFVAAVEADEFVVSEPPADTSAPGVPLNGNGHGYLYEPIADQLDSLAQAAKQQAAESGR